MQAGDDDMVGVVSLNTPLDDIKTTIALNARKYYGRHHEPPPDDGDDRDSYGPWGD